MKAVEVRFTEGPAQDRLVGTLLAQGASLYFEYADSWLKHGQSEAILDEVRQAVAQWPAFAKTAGLTASRTRAIGRILSARLD